MHQDKSMEKSFTFFGCRTPPLLDNFPFDDWVREELGELCIQPMESLEIKPMLVEGKAASVGGIDIIDFHHSDVFQGAF
jgi:hypothetical protein